MRKQLVIALAYELKNFSNREEAYEWFRKTVEEYKLDSHEQFSLVFIGGGMNHRPETPEPPKVCPWEDDARTDHDVLLQRIKDAFYEGYHDAEKASYDVYETVDELWEKSEAKRVYDVLKNLWSSQ